MTVKKIYNQKGGLSKRLNVQKVYSQYGWHQKGWLSIRLTIKKVDYQEGWPSRRLTIKKIDHQEGWLSTRFNEWIHFEQRVISASINPILYMALNCQDAFWLKYLSKLSISPVESFKGMRFKANKILHIFVFLRLIKKWAVI